MVDRSASTSSLPVTHGPETQMLNLKILQNLSQSNIYRDEKSKEGVRSLEKTLLGEGPRYTHRQAALAAGMDPQKARKIWRNMGFSDTPAEEHYFSDRDVQLLRTIVELEREGEVTFESAQSIVRSVGQLTTGLWPGRSKALLMISSPAKASATRRHAAPCSLNCLS